MNQNYVKSNSTDGDVELTPMEVTCLKLSANGYRTREIGSDLRVSEDKIETLLTNAQHKLGAKNRLHAIGIAVSQRLIGLDNK
jgi:DNA-binding CsgD family transcriptional regulator